MGKKSKLGMSRREALQMKREEQRRRREEKQRQKRRDVAIKRTPLSAEIEVVTSLVPEVASLISQLTGDPPNGAMKLTPIQTYKKYYKETAEWIVETHQKLEDSTFLVGIYRSQITGYLYFFDYINKKPFVENAELAERLDTLKNIRKKAWSVYIKSRKNSDYPFEIDYQDLTKQVHYFFRGDDDFRYSRESTPSIGINVDIEREPDDYDEYVPTQAEQLTHDLLVGFSKPLR